MQIKISREVSLTPVQNITDGNSINTIKLERCTAKEPPIQMLGMEIGCHLEDTGRFLSFPSHEMRILVRMLP